MKKYTFTRSAIVEEVFVVEAENVEQARDMLFDPPDPIETNWLDWYTDRYELCGDELVECADCGSEIEKEDSFATTAGRIVCGECADNTI